MGLCGTLRELFISKSNAKFPVRNVRNNPTAPNLWIGRPRFERHTERVSTRYVVLQNKTVESLRPTERSGEVDPTDVMHAACTDDASKGCQSVRRGSFTLDGLWHSKARTAHSQRAKG